MNSRLLLLLLGIVCVASAEAHKFAPSLLVLSETGDQVYAVSWKTPRFAATPVPLEPQLPTACAQQAAPGWAYEGTGVKLDWTVRCSAPLRGQSISVSGLAENQAMVLARIEWRDGVVQQGMLSATEPVYVVPAQASRLRVAADYIRLGVVHILGGPDHLLFVLGLVLLVSGARTLFWTITAFTIGHSATLALAALGILRYPVDLIEFAIAFSIFVIAVELTRGASETHWLRHRPWLAAVSFGLLHGMGFAGALLDAGLPEHAIPLALACFNVGIELGQLLFVAAVLGSGLLWRRMAPARLAPLGWAPVYLIGVGAAYWCIERGAALFAGAA